MAHARSESGTPSGVARPSTVGTVRLSCEPRSASTTPPAIVAAHSGTAAAMAIGMPRRTSLIASSGHGSARTGDATTPSAGAIDAASINPSTPRAAAGSARRPNAGTSTTVGVTRAHARPSAVRSTPDASNTRTTSRIRSAATGGGIAAHLNTPHASMLRAPHAL